MSTAPVILGNFEYHNCKILLQSFEEDGEVKIELIEWVNKFDDDTKSIFPYTFMDSAMKVFEGKIAKSIAQTRLCDVVEYDRDVKARKVARVEARYQGFVMSPDQYLSVPDGFYSGVMNDNVVEFFYQDPAMGIRLSEKVILAYPLKGKNALVRLTFRNKRPVEVTITNKSEEDIPTIATAAEQYKIKLDLAIQEANGGGDEWNARFRQGLERHGLVLTSDRSCLENKSALYPDGLPHQAPQPFRGGDISLFWEYESFVVWNDTMKNNIKG